MKFTLAYYLILLYVAVMFKAAIPVVSDVWSHEFSETEHIATVHAKFGCNHLQKEVADLNKENNQKGPNCLKAGDQLSYHLMQQEFKYNFSPANNNKQYSVFKCGNIPIANIANLAPPPKGIV